MLSFAQLVQTCLTFQWVSGHVASSGRETHETHAVWALQVDDATLDGLKASTQPFQEISVQDASSIFKMFFWLVGPRSRPRTSYCSCYTVGFFQNCWWFQPYWPLYHLQHWITLDICNNVSMFMSMYLESGLPNEELDRPKHLHAWSIVAENLPRTDSLAVVQDNQGSIGSASASHLKQPKGKGHVHKIEPSIGEW